MAAIAQALLFLRVADEGGLDQDRGDIGALSTANPARCTSPRCTTTQATEIGQDHGCGLGTVLDGRVLRHVHQHGRQEIVVGREIHAADQIRAVLAIRQPFRRLAARTAVGQGVDRGAFGVGVGEGVGMDRNEEIGATFARRIAMRSAARHSNRRRGS
jgi:hypothetical protein